MSGIDEEVMGSFLKRFDKNVNWVLSGSYASWKELEKEPPLRYNEIFSTKYTVYCSQSWIPFDYTNFNIGEPKGIWWIGKTAVL